MIDNMDPTPAPEVLLDDVDNTTCTEEQTSLRLNTCMKCDKFQVTDETTKCSESGCNINLLITYTFKSCPLGKW